VNHLNHLFELADERNQLRFAWLRNILTIATGTLALLVALRPTGHLSAEQKCSLIACWIFLGAGIIFGAIATYGEVAMASELAKRFKEELLKVAQETGRWEVTTPVVAKPHWIWQACQAAMCICLLLGVVALVVYATLGTLSAN
jgi:hypothetical protein